ncbi:hypothetical protein [Sorangium sp. So ce406]|uniref:hypothetical protein n=1 Tax=Sorangium sp. So ce406 TaxID=3133311 RepID=UPI003F5B64DD
MPLLRHPLRSIPSIAIPALLVSGCGTLLGLDEFTDARPTGSGGTGGGDAAPCERGDTRPCYEGESETEGVGLCAPGTQTCGGDGTWGACEEQVLPGEEDCNERGDEDCDGVGCSDVLWARMSSAGPFRLATSVAISPRGDRIAVAGLYRGTLNFGPDATTALPEHPRGGAFLAVFDGEGNYVYSIALPLSGDSAAAVALDAESNVLFATKYTGTVNLGGDDLPASGTTDMLVAKLDAKGGHVWSRQFGDPEGQLTPIDIAVTSDGDAVITGMFSRTVNFGGSTLENAEGSSGDAFLVRLSGEDGGHVYSVRIGDRTGDPAGYQGAKGVGVDAMGRAVVAGTFENSVDFGTGHTQGSAWMGQSGWVAMFDAEGMLLWNTVFRHGDGSTVDIAGVDVDAEGNSGIAGSFSGAVTFQGTNDSVHVTRRTTGADDNDLFVVRLSSTGTHSWSKQLGDASSQVGGEPIWGVALDSESALVFAGGFRGKVDFGGGELTSSDYDWFVAKFDASGAHRWSHRYGSAAATQTATAAAVHEQTREIVVTGISDGAIDLADPPLMMDNLSVVLARISP